MTTAAIITLDPTARQCAEVARLHDEMQTAMRTLDEKVKAGAWHIEDARAVVDAHDKWQAAFVGSVSAE